MKMKKLTAAVLSLMLSASMLPGALVSAETAAPKHYRQNANVTGAEYYLYDYSGNPVEITASEDDGEATYTIGAIPQGFGYAKIEFEIHSAACEGSVTLGGAEIASVDADGVITAADGSTKLAPRTYSDAIVNIGGAGGALKLSIGFPGTVSVKYVGLFESEGYAKIFNNGYVFYDFSDYEGLSPFAVNNTGLTQPKNGLFEWKDNVNERQWQTYSKQRHRIWMDARDLLPPDGESGTCQIYVKHALSLYKGETGANGGNTVVRSNGGTNASPSGGTADVTIGTNTAGEGQRPYKKVVTDVKVSTGYGGISTDIGGDAKDAGFNGYVRWKYMSAFKTAAQRDNFDPTVKSVTINGIKADIDPFAHKAIVYAEDGLSEAEMTAKAFEPSITTASGDNVTKGANITVGAIANGAPMVYTDNGEVIKVQRYNVTDIYGTVIPWWVEYKSVQGAAETAYQVYDFSKLTDEKVTDLKANVLKNYGDRTEVRANNYNGPGLQIGKWNDEYQDVSIKFDKIDYLKDTWIKVCYIPEEMKDDISDRAYPIIAQWISWGSGHHGGTPEIWQYDNGYYTGEETWTAETKPSNQHYNELILKVPAMNEQDVKQMVQEGKENDESYLRLLFNDIQNGASKCVTLKYVGLFYSEEDAKKYDPSIVSVKSEGISAKIDPIKHTALLPMGLDTSKAEITYYNALSGDGAKTALKTKGDTEETGNTNYTTYTVYSMKNKFAGLGGGLNRGNAKTGAEVVWTVVSGDINDLPDIPDTDDPYKDLPDPDPSENTGEKITLFRKIGNVGYIYDFSNVSATNEYVNGNSANYTSNGFVGLRSIIYGGPALQLQAWGNNNVYLTFKGTESLRKTHKYAKIVFEVSDMSNSNGYIQLGTPDGASDNVNLTDTDTEKKRYISKVIDVEPGVSNGGDLSLIVKNGTNIGVNIKYLAFFNTKKNADSFDEGVIGARLGDIVCKVDNIKHKILAVLPENMSQAELADIQADDVKLFLYNSQSDYEKAFAKGYNYDHRCRIVSMPAKFTVDGRTAAAEFIVTNVAGKKTVWTFEATSNGEAPVNNSAVIGAVSMGRTAKIDAQNKQIIFRGGDIGAVEYSLADGSSIKEEGAIRTEGDSYVKEITIETDSVCEKWTLIMPNETELNLVLGDNYIWAKLKNAPTGSESAVALYDGAAMKEVALGDTVEDIPDGEYNAKLFLWDKLNAMEPLKGAQEINYVSRLYKNGNYDVTNARKKEWEPVPLVSQRQIDDGMTGGEGGQVNTWIEMSADGRLMLMFEDIGCMYKSTDKGVTWTEAGKNAGSGLTYGAIDPTNSDRVIAVSCNSSNETAVTRKGYTENGLFLSEDGGETFTQSMIYTDPVMTRFRDAVVFDISSYDADDIGGCAVAYFSTSSDNLSNSISNYEKGKGYNNGSGLYKTTDGGMSWNLVNSTMSNAELAADENGRLYAAKDGILYRSTNGGTSFSRVTNINVDDVCIVNGNIYVVGDSGVSVSSDNGTSFKERTNKSFVNTPGTAHPTDFKVNPLDENIMMYGYQAEELYKEVAYYSHDGGNSWCSSAHNGEHDFYNKQPRRYSFTFDNSDKNVVFTTCDWPLKSTDGGKSFSASSNGVLGTCINADWTPNVYNEDLWFVPAQDFSGAITTDGGKTFKAIDSIDTQNLISHVYGGYVVDENTYFCLTSNEWGSRMTDTSIRNLVMTTDGGKTWEIKGQPTIGYRDWYCTQSAANKNLLFAGNLMSSDGGKSWTQLPEPIGKVFGSNSSTGRLFAVGYGDKSTPEGLAAASTIYVSDTEGASWQVLFTLPKDSSRDYHGIQYFARYNETDNSIYYNYYGYLNKYNCTTGTHTDYEDKLKSAMGGNMGFAKSFAIDKNNADILYIGMDSSVGKQYKAINDKDRILRSCDGGNSWQVISSHNTERSIVRTGPAIGQMTCSSLFVADDGYVYASFANQGLWKFAPPYTVKKVGMED